MTALDDKLAELGARFRARAGDELAAIDAAIGAGDRQAVIDKAHKLAGIAGMFGFHEVGDAALALEESALRGADLGESAAPLRTRLQALAQD